MSSSQRRRKKGVVDSTPGRVEGVLDDLAAVDDGVGATRRQLADDEVGIAFAEKVLLVEVFGEKLNRHDIL